MLHVWPISSSLTESSCSIPCLREVVQMLPLQYKDSRWSILYIIFIQISVRTYQWYSWLWSLTELWFHIQLASSTYMLWNRALLECSWKDNILLANKDMKYSVFMQWHSTTTCPVFSYKDTTPLYLQCVSYHLLLNTNTRLKKLRHPYNILYIIYLHCREENFYAFFPLYLSQITSITLHIVKCCFTQLTWEGLMTMYN